MHLIEPYLKLTLNSIQMNYHEQTYSKVLHSNSHVQSTTESIDNVSNVNNYVGQLSTS